MGIFRLLLAICVLLVHAQQYFGIYGVYGDAAVQTFYIFSGFYIALIMHEKYVGMARPWKLFYENRILRLAPTFFLLLAATVAFTVWRTGDFRGWFQADPLVLALALATNLSMIGQDIWVFLTYDPATGALGLMPPSGVEGLPRGVRAGWTFIAIPQGWSLGVEIWFYIVAPFFITRGFRVILPLLGLALASRAIVAWWYAPTLDSWYYRFFPSELFLFLLGYISYRLYVYFRETAPHLLSRVGPLWLGGLLIFSLAYKFIPIDNDLKRWIYLSCMMLAVPSLFHLTRRWSLDQWAGDMSYPFYLCHLVVMHVTALFGAWLGAATGWVALVISLFVSFLIVACLERPIDRWRQRRVSDAGGRTIEAAPEPRHGAVAERR